MNGGSRPVVAALDVGGTAIKASLVAADGTVTVRRSVPTPVADGPDAVVAAVRALAGELCNGPEPVVAAAAVIPGSVDDGAGRARYSANIGWRDVPLRALLAADLELPVAVQHDVWAAGLAERRIGAARDESDCVVTVVGTGIAAVLVSGDMVVAGASGVPGEIGHLPVYPDGEVCACGARGCLEAYASAAAIAHRYAMRSGVALSAREIADRVGLDPVADQVWADAAEAFGLAFAAVSMLLDPALIVLGGGLAGAGERLLVPVRRALAARMSWRAAPELRLSVLGAQAGVLGAAILGWSLVGLTDVAHWATAVST